MDNLKKKSNNFSFITVYVFDRFHIINDKSFSPYIISGFNQIESIVENEFMIH